MKKIYVPKLEPGVLGVEIDSDSKAYFGIGSTTRLEENSSCHTMIHYLKVNGQGFSLRASGIKFVVEIIDYVPMRLAEDASDSSWRELKPDEKKPRFIHVI